MENLEDAFGEGIGAIASSVRGGRLDQTQLSQVKVALLLKILYFSLEALSHLNQEPEMEELGCGDSAMLDKREKAMPTGTEKYKEGVGVGMNPRFWRALALALSPLSLSLV